MTLDYTHYVWHEDSKITPILHVDLSINVLDDHHRWTPVMELCHLTHEIIVGIPMSGSDYHEL